VGTQHCRGSTAASTDFRPATAGFSAVDFDQFDRCLPVYWDSRKITMGFALAFTNVQGCRKRKESLEASSSSDHLVKWPMLLSSNAPEAMTKLETRLNFQTAQ